MSFNGRHRRHSERDLRDKAAASTLPITRTRDGRAVERRRGKWKEEIEGVRMRVHWARQAGRCEASKREKGGG